MRTISNGYVYVHRSCLFSEIAWCGVVTERTGGNGVCGARRYRIERRRRRRRAQQCNGRPEPSRPRPHSDAPRPDLTTVGRAWRLDRLHRLRDNNPYPPVHMHPLWYAQRQC